MSRISQCMLFYMEWHTLDSMQRTETWSIRWGTWPKQTYLRPRIPRRIVPSTCRLYSWRYCGINSEHYFQPGYSSKTMFSFSNVLRNRDDRWVILYGSLCFHHGDVTQWRRFLRYWPFLREIHQLLVDSPHKGPVMRALLFFFDVSLSK